MPQPDPPELHQVQPDRPPAPFEDTGVHAWPLGGYMPMGFYRPVPIVRFTGTIVLQNVINLVLLGLLFELDGLVTIAACTLVALLLARRALRRWLGQASTFWKVATLVALALNLALVAIASLSPARDSALFYGPTPGAEPVLQRHFVPGEPAALGRG